MSPSADMELLDELIGEIVHPRPEAAPLLLEQLKLASLPTPDEVHEDIERKLLLPPRAFPVEWSSYYQVYEL